MKSHAKLIALLLCVSVFLCAAPLSGLVGLKLPDFIPSISASAAVETGTCGKSVTWSLDKETGVLTISGTGPMTDYGAFSESDYPPWGMPNGTIRSVIIEDGVTRIGDYAFHASECLSSIFIPESVTSIGKDAFFYTAYYHDEANWDNGVLYIEDNLIEADDTVTGEYTVKSGTKRIADGAFEESTELTSINIPDSLSSFTSKAFGSSGNVTSVNVSDSSPYFSSIDGIVFNKDKTEIVSFPFARTDTAYVIPGSVTSIGSGAFYYCAKLTSITIPDGVTSIGSGAFYFCTGLTSLSLPDDVTSIGSEAFNFCTRLTSINIPDGVLSIGDSAFSYCRGLTSIIVPDSVTDIGTDAFFGMHALTDIYIMGNDVSLSSSAIGFSKDVITWETVCNIPTVIHGYPGSTAEAYATDNSLTFMVIDDTCSHSNMVIINAVSASCTTEGYSGDAYCADCDTIVSTGTIIPAYGHTVYNSSAISATCTQAGLTAGAYCLTCHEILTAQIEIPALGHAWDDGVITTAPTCSFEGEATYTCTRCYTTKTEAVAATAHTPVDVDAVPATCLNVGYTAGTRCSVCHTVLSGCDVIPMIEHTWDDGVITTPATCAVAGVKTFHCTRCYMTKTEAVATVAHTPVNDAQVPASCTGVGFAAGTHCSVCNTLLSGRTEIPALGHIDADGDNICDRCGVEMPAEQDCSCDCHNDSFFKRIFWKLKVFFWKLFGKEDKRVCSCGEAHW